MDKKYQMFCYNTDGRVVILQHAHYYFTSKYHKSLLMYCYPIKLPLFLSKPVKCLVWQCFWLFKNIKWQPTVANIFYLHFMNIIQRGVPHSIEITNLKILTTKKPLKNFLFILFSDISFLFSTYCILINNITYCSFFIKVHPHLVNYTKMVTGVEIIISFGLIIV